MIETAPCCRPHVALFFFLTRCWQDLYCRAVCSRELLKQAAANHRRILPHKTNVIDGCLHSTLLNFPIVASDFIPHCYYSLFTLFQLSPPLLSSHQNLLISDLLVLSTTSKSNFSFGTLLARSGSDRSRRCTTAVLWRRFWCSISQTTRHLAK